MTKNPYIEAILFLLRHYAHGGHADALRQGAIDRLRAIEACEAEQSRAGEDSGQRDAAD